MIVVGVPTYDSRVHNRLMLALLNELVQPGVPPFTVISNHSSLLARGFNELYCYALNERPKATHFLMVHADVVPEPGWILAMRNEMERVGCDVLSAALPLKDNRGLTSTALDMPGKEPKRLSMAELERLPVTFGAEDCGGGLLLVNSGLLLIDIRKPWAEECWFAITDRVERRGEKWQPVTDSEDWYFSRRAHGMGAKVRATRAMKARHMGEMAFPNWGEWGTHKQDDADGSVTHE